MKISIVLGTRPEIIKMSPIIRECERLGLDYFILHTGQHYSYNMDDVFFEQLSLTKPKYNLKVGSGTHAEETGRMLIGLERILQAERPDVVLVEGDTNTVLAGALAAAKLRVRVGHVEAGLRSYDREMPEEVNRLIVDHVSDYLFAPTGRARDNLLREGIAESKIFVTGNTIVDAIMQNIKLAEEFGPRNGVPDEYFLVTLHRQENVDREERLRRILRGLELLASSFEAPIIFPIHPRTANRIRDLGIQLDSSIRLVEPFDYLGFLWLLKNARLVLTDSGGVQEEACILKVPCVTIRYNTERPETVDVGANIIAGTEPKSILEKARLMLERDRCWENPFGDGRAACRIVEILRRKLD
ncbi:MAG: non-hydrolyzing UDP-N-acetylglucosamine 2-epimerase [Candidatus Bathycorpusculaceae bacterium]